MIDALIFDLDGTLIDSVPDVGAAMNRMLAGAGYAQIPDENVSDYVGWGAHAMIKKALATAGILSPDGELKQRLEEYLAFYRAAPAERTIIYPGVLDVLNNLAATGIPMGVCTNKPHAMSKLVLDTLDMSRYFAAVLGGDIVPHRKPDGRHVHDTLHLMNAEDRSAVMIGDSETDMTAGRDAGLPVIAVTYGYAHGDPYQLDADICIDRFTDLPEALRRLSTPDSIPLA
jgi:phosphoglycolate phosphatase